MCLTAKQIFNPPIPVMTCWKILVGSKGRTDYYTPHMNNKIDSKTTNTLVANGKDFRERVTYPGQQLGMGYIHSFKTRKAARAYIFLVYGRRYYKYIFKCEAHNVHAIGEGGDIISDSITIFWDKKG